MDGSIMGIIIAVVVAVVALVMYKRYVDHRQWTVKDDSLGRDSRNIK